MSSLKSTSRGPFRADRLKSGSPERRAHVATLDVAALDALVEVLRTRRAWPAT